MHFPLLYQILLFSLILLIGAQGQAADDNHIDGSGYENCSAADLKDLGWDDRTIADFMKARAAKGQGQSNAQGNQQANNSPPPSPPRQPTAEHTVTQSAPPSRPTATQQQNEDDWFGHDETNWNDHNDHNNGTHVHGGSSSSVYRENWDDQNDVNWSDGNDYHNNDTHVHGGSSSPAHGENLYDHENAAGGSTFPAFEDYDDDDADLRRILAETAQDIQPNDSDEIQSAIEASLALEDERQIQLARKDSMREPRNNYDKGIGSDNEEIGMQEVLYRSLSTNSNQRRNNRVSNPQVRIKYGRLL
ncbi:hypothetical protein niasHT_013197 [Heterodera trifolii]|uniref:Secreted protein n=1 Tax=Heterodera trifolii TaxID=157864 RepID=A0ABD2LDU2_9BILA